MFKFFKNKISKAVEKFSKSIDKEAKTEEIPEQIPETLQQKDSKARETQKDKSKETNVTIHKEKIEDKEKIKKEEIKKTSVEETKEKIKETKTEEKAVEKEGFFSRIKRKITTKVLNEKKFEELFFELELALLENNVAYEVIDKIKSDLKENLVNKPVPRDKIAETIINALKQSISEVLSIETTDLLKLVNTKKPFVIMFVGVNGAGKTTTIAKIANLLKKHNKSVVLAASDTFRAAALEQLEEHAKNLNIKMIKHDYGSDAAAVAYDAIQYAKSRNIDVVLIDTAGRLHSNINLMDELKKIERVAKPDYTIFVGESITGNDCVEQAKKFSEFIKIDGIILSKADVDEKGGAALSISYITHKPILYLGTGQSYDDLEMFNKERIISSIGL